MWRFYRNGLASFGVFSIYPIGVLISTVIQMAAAGSLAIPESTNTAAFMLVPFVLFFRYLRYPFDEMLMQNIYRSSYWAFITIMLALVLISAFSAHFPYDGFTVACMVALPLGILVFCILPLVYDLKDARNARSED